MTMRRLLVHRQARRYLTGQTLSLLGDSSMWLVSGIWVQTLTGDNGAAGLTFFFFTAPAVLAPFAGYLVDRVRRLRLLLAANLAGALMVLPLLLVNGAEDVTLIYGVMLLYGMLNVVIAPAQSALLAGLLPDDLRISANGVLRTVQESLRFLAPVVGAGLFTLFGGRVVVLLDSLTFLAAAAILLTIRHDEPRPSQAPNQDESRAAWRRLAAEIGAGFRFILASPVLRRVTLAAVAATIVLGVSESVTFAIVTDGLRRSAEFIGVTQAGQGVGAIIGGLAAASLIRRISEARAVSAGMVLFALGTVMTAVPTVGWVLAGKAISGAGLTVALVALLSLLQRLAPSHLQGRVFAGVEVASTVPQSGAIVLGAALVGFVPYQILLGGQAVLMVVAAASIALWHRRQPSRPATGEPVPVASGPTPTPRSAKAADGSPGRTSRPSTRQDAPR